MYYVQFDKRSLKLRYVEFEHQVSCQPPKENQEAHHVDAIPVADVSNQKMQRFLSFYWSHSPLGNQDSTVGIIDWRGETKPAQPPRV